MERDLERRVRAEFTLRLGSTGSVGNPEAVRALQKASRKAEKAGEEELTVVVRGDQVEVIEPEEAGEG